MKKLTDADYVVSHIQLREKLHDILATYRSCGMAQRRVSHYPFHATERRGSALHMERPAPADQLPFDGRGASVGGSK